MDRCVFLPNLDRCVIPFNQEIDVYPFRDGYLVWEGLGKEGNRRYIGIGMEEKDCKEKKRREEERGRRGYMGKEVKKRR